MLPMLWKAAVDVAQWCWGNKRAAAECFLVMALALLGWRYNHDRAILKAETEAAQGLAAGIGLQLKITQNQLEILKRDADGKVTYRDIYVPPEGYVLVDQKEKDALQSQLDALTAKLKSAIASGDHKAADDIQKQIGQIDPGIAVTVKDHGWTFKPGYGLDWADRGIKPRLDLKWAYYKRYSLLAGGSENGAGPGISRHLDDIIWGKPANAEIFLQWNALKFHPGDSVVTIGLRSNF